MEKRKYRSEKFVFSWLGRRESQKVFDEESDLIRVPSRGTRHNSRVDGFHHVWGLTFTGFLYSTLTLSFPWAGQISHNPTSKNYVCWLQTTHPPGTWGGPAGGNGEPAMSLVTSPTKPQQTSPYHRGLPRLTQSQLALAQPLSSPYPSLFFFTDFITNQYYIPFIASFFPLQWKLLDSRDTVCFVHWIEQGGPGKQSINI